MRLGEHRDVAPISPANGARERNAACGCGTADKGVARHQPLRRQRQATEPILRQRIDPRLIQNQIWAIRIEHWQQGFRQRRKIGGVPGSVRQRDIAGRACLARRKILLGMNRIGGDSRMPGGERRRAVPLMHVAIDHQHPPRILFGQTDRSDGEIVEHAIASARRRQRMMAAARTVRRKTAFEGKLARQPRAARHHRSARRHRWRYGKADPTFLVARDAGGEHLGDIVRIVRGLEPAQGHRHGFVPFDRGTVCAQQIADCGILAELEFKNIQVVADFEPIQVKDVTITPTPSRNQLSTAEDAFPEHGLLVNDGEVTLWNQVDSLVNPDIIQHIGELYGQVDFFHSRFVPLIEGNFSYNKSLGLPIDEYCTFLNVVKALAPRFVVPGSAAFRYRDELTFLNQYSFPTTQDQFLRDLALFCPEVPCAPFFSGDVAHIAKEEIRIDKQASSFVRVKEDDSHRVIFKPNTEVPVIKTQTTDPEQYKREMAVVENFLENCLMERILNSELLEGWQHWQIVYQLEVFGQEGVRQTWTLDFAQPEKLLKLHKGEIGKINLYEGISCSELCALIEGTTSWDYVTLCGNYRTFNNIYRIANGALELPPEDKSNYALEPLMDIFPWDLDMDHRKFMRDVKRWKGKSV